MSDIKKQLEADIEKRVKKILDSRKAASKIKSVEGYVLEFLQQMQDYNSTPVETYQHALILAKDLLNTRLQTWDRGVGFQFKFRVENGRSTIVGVTIHWSQHYQSKEGTAPSLYVGIEDLLFI